MNPRISRPDLLAKIKHMRGELSAIGCWAQVHAKAHPGEAALMRLSSLLHLAGEEKNNSHFMVVGPFSSRGEMQTRNVH